MSIVNPPRPPPGPSPSFRRWLKSVMRGWTGINLGNLISGAVEHFNLTELPGDAGAGPGVASSWDWEGAGGARGGGV